MSTLAQFDHPSWTAAVGTLASYLLLLAGMTLVFFGVPYAIFTALG